jgi:type II secretory pathway pseudopilin PulG
VSLTIVTLRRLRSRLQRDERGFALIEVLVSAMLLVLVATGVYAGLDGASNTSGLNKRRSQASAVAQQDQDRMRSMGVAELSNYREDHSVPVGVLDYRVISTASWVTDDTGSASCTSGQAQAHYLRIESSVTWAQMTVAPVTIESIVAPPAGSFGGDVGSLAVQVRDRNGVGEPGVSVSLAGARSYTDVTNDAGCVLWGYLPGGNYTVSLARAGYVDPNGVANPAKTVGVVGGATATTAFDYDLGGQIQAGYETLNGATPVPANPSSFSAVTSHLTVPLGPFGGTLSSVVFPFTDPYGAYAGACAGADPVANGQPAQLAQVTPGGTVSVTLREPPVNLLVLRNGAPVGGAVVRLTGTGSGCGALPTRTTAADGYLTDRALPYGPYDVCVQATFAGSTYRMTGTVANTVPTGVPVGSATYELRSAPLGTCP